MVNRDTLADYLDEILSVSSFSDACPNGLQVEGRPTISRLVTGVTASQALIDSAIDCQADAIIAHHGYFWKGESLTVVGTKQKRLKALLTHDINLFVYHVPLDAHLGFGNNALLCQALGASSATPFGPQGVGLIARLSESVTLSTLSDRLSRVVGRIPFVAGDVQKTVSTIGVCTGAAQSLYLDAIAQGADCFISGEISEHNAVEAVEMGRPYLAAGHHATERLGVTALGEHLAKAFDLTVNFVDIDTRL